MLHLCGLRVDDSARGPTDRRVLLPATNHPGHGPYCALTTKVEGKTGPLQLRPEAEADQDRAVGCGLQALRGFAGQRLEINEAICDGRPEGPASPGHGRGGSACSSEHVCAATAWVDLRFVAARGVPGAFRGERVCESSVVPAELSNPPPSPPQTPPSRPPESDVTKSPERQPPAPRRGTPGRLAGA